jgi:hypothetical protein
MIPIEGLTPLGRRKLSELVGDLDRELQIAGTLVSNHGKQSQAERVAAALTSVGALQKKGSVEVFTISSAMISDDIASGRAPGRSVSAIVAEAEAQAQAAAAANTAVAAG